MSEQVGGEPSAELPLVPDQDPHAGIDPGTGETDADLESALDEFLEKNAELFADSERHWDLVRQGQQKVAKVTEQAAQMQMQPNVPYGMKPAHKQGDPKRTAANVNLQINKSARNGVILYFQKIYGKLDEITPEEVETLIQTEMVYQRRAHTTQVKQMTAINPTFRAAVQGMPGFGDIMNTISDTELSLEVAYIRAFYAQGKAGRALNLFLGESDDRIGPFLERTEEWVEYANVGLHEYPGLLEVLAAHVVPEPMSPFLRAVGRTQVDAEALRRDFLHAALYPTDEHMERKFQRKELLPLIAGMRFVADSVRVDHGIEPMTLAERLAAKFEQWPEDLQSAFEAALEAERLQAAQRVREMLSPFVRKGRLPPAGKMAVSSHVTFPNLHVPKKAGQKNKGQRRDRTTPPPTTTNNQDVEDVFAEAEAEREPIKTYAILKQLGGSKVHQLQVVGGIDELMKHSAVTRYLNRYDGDQAAALREIIDFVSRNPHDHANSGRVPESYTLDGSAEGIKGGASKTRRFMMFKPRQLPGMAKTELTDKIRFTYDIVILNGESCLVINEIASKNDDDKFI